MVQKTPISLLPNILYEIKKLQTAMAAPIATKIIVVRLRMICKKYIAKYKILIC